MVSAAVRDFSASSASDQSRVAHIDGLRAIAVLAVVAFHAGVPGIPGGFAGVDIFFVVSGYLIINHIAQELAAGEFSFAQFYARRTLRLFPPLFLVIAVTALAAFLTIFTAYEWRQFWRSAEKASLFVSNFFFLRRNYFDVTAAEKPLLHTWSLSVEEQFYIVVPLLLAGCFVFAARSKINVYRVLAIAALLVFAVSLIGCIIQTTPGRRNFAFYMTYWRAWEFVAGGAIGFLQGGILARVRPAIANAMGFAGLALIAASLFLISETDPYPSYRALFPVFGTVLVIAAGFAAPGALAARLISFRPLTFIGVVSYGWYLWHWPMISLARIAQYGEPSLARSLTMAALSFGLAVITYYLVERPARRIRERADLARTGKWFVIAGIAAALAVSTLAKTIGPSVSRSIDNDPAVNTSSEAFVAASVCPATICADVTGKRGIIIGDSHTEWIKSTLVHQAGLLGVTVDHNLSYILEQLKHQSLNPGLKADTEFAVVSYYWGYAPWKYSTTEQLITTLRERGVKRILLIGPMPDFRYWAAACYLRARHYGHDADYCAKPRDELETRLLPAIAELKRLAAKYSEVRLAVPFPLFCDAKTCRPFKNGVLLYQDTNHLIIPYGADWLYYHLKEDFWWALGGNSVPATATTK